MPDYYGISPVQWARSLVTTTAEFLPMIEEEAMKNYKFLKLLKSKGRVSYNHAGRGCTWQVQYRLAPVEGNTGETVRVFSPNNYWLKAELPWRGFQATDAISERERMENRGRAAVINVMNGFVERLKNSLEHIMNLAWIPDGNATGNEMVWHGIESLMGTNGTINISTGAQRAANNADIVAYPSDNYAGLSTQLGAYGGDNEAGQVWPNGNDDPEFACVTPLIVNYSSTAFSGADNTFRSKGEEAMRYAVTKSYRTALGGRQMNLFLLSNDLYYQFKMSQAGKERLIVSSNTGLRALGFDDVIHLDGIEVTYENSINSRWGYGINADNIELRNIYDSIVKAKAEDFKYNHVTQRVEAAVVNLGNLCFRSPRNTVKLMPYTDM